MCNRFSNSNCISNGPGTAFHSGAHEFIYGLSGVCVAQSLVCFLLFCGSCFSFCPFFSMPLYWLSFFSYLLLGILLISSHFSSIFFAIFAAFFLFVQGYIMNQEICYTSDTNEVL
jgi:hypothetical protein